MGNPKRRKTKRKIDNLELWIFIITAFIFVGFFLYVYYNSSQEPEEYPSIEIVDAESSQEETQGPIQTVQSVEGVMHVHMIDCDQGDCFLFECNGLYGMIDCGPRQSEKDDKIVEYLRNQGVTKLQFFVGTHQHDDHMGDLLNILKNFSVKTVYMPNTMYTPDANEPSKQEDYVKTPWYQKLMKYIETNNIKVKNPKKGTKFHLGDATFEVLAQLRVEECQKDLNNVSTIIKVSFGQMDILMVGDAEAVVEKVLLNSKKNLECEVLKVGHHGSDSSTTQAFLDAVNPDYALISSGVGNKYKHPCTVTMEKLEAKGVIVYRTDETGTVVLSVESNNISFDTKPGDYRDGVTIGMNRGFSYE